MIPYRTLFLLVILCLNGPFLRAQKVLDGSFETPTLVCAIGVAGPSGVNDIYRQIGGRFVKIYGKGVTAMVWISADNGCGKPGLAKGCYPFPDSASIVGLGFCKWRDTSTTVTSSLTMRLSRPMEVDTLYLLRWYDLAYDSLLFIPNGGPGAHSHINRQDKLLIGFSNNDSTFGQHQVTVQPEVNKWTRRQYIFRPNFPATQITAQDAAGFVPDTSDYACNMLDGFHLYRIRRRLHDSIMCKGDSLQLTASETGKPYEWSTGASVRSIQVKDTGWFSVWTYYTDSTIMIDSFHVAYAFPDTNTVKAAIACDADPVRLEATVPARPVYSYTWSTGAASRDIQVTDTGWYWVRVKYRHCEHTDSFHVSRIPRLPLGLPSDTACCTGDSVRINAQHPAYSQYAWNTRETSPQVMLKQPGMYTVTASNGYCMVKDSIRLSFYPVPDAALPDELFSCFDHVKILSVKAAPKFQDYTWGPGGETDAELKVTAPGMYWVTVTDDHHCRAGDTIQVISRCPGTVFIPTAFTPNGDDLNDVFRVEGRNLLEVNLQVYNRWGEQVFEGNGPGAGWNGIYKGRAAMEDVYFYQVRCRFYNTKYQLLDYYYSGSVTLLR